MFRPIGVAVVGALLGSLVSQYFRLIALVFLGHGSAGAGWMARLADAGAMLVYGAFLSPWGWLGAIFGGVWGWRNLVVRHRRAAEPAAGTEVGDDRQASDGLLRHGEAQLACGIALLGVAALLAPQVMIGLLGLMLAPAVLALLLVGAWRVRDADLPWGRQVVGFILLLLALAGLVMATGSAVETSARAARLTQIREDRMRAVRPATPAPHPEDPAAAALRTQVESELENLSRHPAHAPPEPHWLGRAAFWLSPIFMGLGLCCRAAWSPWRCLFWAGVVWVFPYGMARLIQTLGPSMVLSA